MFQMIFDGNLTADPEYKTVNGKDGPTGLTNFTVAVNNRRTKKTVFLRCEAWNGNSENIVKFFHKGDLIVITSGELIEDEWVDKNSGEKRRAMKVRVNTWEFPNKPKKSEEDSGEDTQSEPEPQSTRPVPTTLSGPSRGKAEVPKESPKTTATRTRNNKPAPAPPPIDDEDEDEDDIPF